MSIFSNNVVTPADVQYRHFDKETNINGLMTKKAVIFYALGVKPESMTSVAVAGSLLNGSPDSMFDTFPNGVRFVLTEDEAKTLATGVMSYMECYANSLEEALLLINKRNQKRIKEDKISLSSVTGKPVDAISDEAVADKITKHYLTNYKNLTWSGDTMTSDLPY